MDTANVRYLVDDVPAAVDFYTKHLEFTVEFDAPAIAVVTRGSLRLLLSGPTSSGARPMPDGRRPEPGWNRVQIIVDDLDREVSMAVRRTVSPPTARRGRNYRCGFDPSSRSHAARRAWIPPER